MNTLVNHDLKAHWEAVVKLWGMLAANCSDFEAAHKWALKQFVKMVPHGQYFTKHLATPQHFRTRRRRVAYSKG